MSANVRRNRLVTKKYTDKIKKFIAKPLGLGINFGDDI
jgi:hypothetical protein